MQRRASLPSMAAHAAFWKLALQITGYRPLMPPAGWSRLKLAWQHNLGVPYVNHLTQALQAEAAAAHDKISRRGDAVCGRPCDTLLSTCAHMACYNC